MKIGIGVFLLLTIIILFILRSKLKKKVKSVEKINKILYLLILIFLVSLCFAAIVGIDYVCPCGCGSTEFDLGFKGMLNFFNEVSYGIFLGYGSFLTYVECLVVGCVVFHFSLLGIKILTMKTRNKKNSK